MEIYTSRTPGNIVWLSWRPSRRRRDIDDPFFEEGDTLCSSEYTQVLVDEDQQDIQESDQTGAEFPCQVSNCKKVFHSNVEYEMHYTSLHRNQCNHCYRNLPTSRLLDIHILEWHDSMFELLVQKQNMFQCLVEGCDLKFQTAKERKNHLIKTHQYPSNFRFDKPKKHTKDNSKAKPADQTNNGPGPTSSGPVEDGGSVAMDTSVPAVRPSTSHTSPPSHTSESGRTFVYNVPKTICFGAGSQRGFSRPRGRGGKGRGQKKHWHQAKPSDMDTSVDIEKVNMTDLADALS